MTVEETASWKRPHELGRRRYQLRSAIRWFGLGLVNALFYQLVLHPEARWTGSLMGVIFWAASVYFFAGHHWDARDEEYRRLTGQRGQA